MKCTLEARINKATLERHTAIFGASGGGKSLLLKAMAESLVRSTAKRRDASIVIMEPHGSLAPELMAARAVESDRLVYFSTTVQKESGWTGTKITPVFNPFQLPKGADETFKNLLAAQIAQTISELVDTAQYGITINMHMLLLPAILVTLSSDNPCMNTLKRMLTDGMNEDLLNIGLNYPHPQIQDFFRHHWGSKDYDITKRALISKTNYLMNDVALYDLLNGDGIDLEECLNSGKVIIVNTPRGANPFVASVVPRLMIAYIFSLVLRRTDAQRKMPVYLFIDEMNSYANSSSLKEAFHQSRKFGLRIIASLQSAKGLPQDMKVALQTNTFLKLLSISDAETRTLMGREMSVGVEELAKIEPLMFMVSKNDGKTKPFRIKVPILSKHLFLNALETKERLRYLIQHSGVYQEVLPPPPPMPENLAQTKPTKKKQSNSDAPFDGLVPGFNPLNDKDDAHK